MGRVAKILSFLHTVRHGATISDIKADPGGGNNVTAQQLTSPGIDAQPLPDDYVYIAGEAGTGREVAIGHVDPASDQKAQAGEMRTYARNSAGASVVEQWHKNDGSSTLTNTLGTLTLGADGSWLITGPNTSILIQADGYIELNSGAASVEVKTTGEIDIKNDAGGLINMVPNGMVSINGVDFELGGSMRLPPGAELKADSIKASNKELAGHTHLAGTPPGNTGPNQ